ncbi:MAG: hypothetical protein ABFC30_01190, partial [Proteiniphilum sp.]
MQMKILFLIIIFNIAAIGRLAAEDGSRLWLRFQPQEMESLPSFTQIRGEASSIALQEFQHAWQQMSGSYFPGNRGKNEHTLLIGSLKNREVRRFIKRNELQE